MSKVEDKVEEIRKAGAELSKLNIMISETSAHLKDLEDKRTSMNYAINDLWQELSDLVIGGTSSG